MKKPKRTRDLNQRAKNVVDLAVGEITEINMYENEISMLFNWDDLMDCGVVGQV